MSCLRRQHRKSFSATTQLADVMLSLGMILSLLFMPPPFQQKQYSQVLEAVRGQGVLTVGETAEFLDACGIVSFTMQREMLQFDVNLNSASKARLKISSQMPPLARRVVNTSEPAKT